MHEVSTCACRWECPRHRLQIIVRGEIERERVKNKRRRKKPSMKKNVLERIENVPPNMSGASSLLQVVSVAILFPTCPSSSKCILATAGFNNVDLSIAVMFATSTATKRGAVPVSSSYRNCARQQSDAVACTETRYWWAVCRNPLCGPWRLIKGLRV